MAFDFGLLGSRVKLLVRALHGVLVCEVCLDVLVGKPLLLLLVHDSSLLDAGS